VGIKRRNCWPPGKRLAGDGARRLLTRPTHCSPSAVRNRTVKQSARPKHATICGLEASSHDRSCWLREEQFLFMGKGLSGRKCTRRSAGGWRGSYDFWVRGTLGCHRVDALQQSGKPLSFVRGRWWQRGLPKYVQVLLIGSCRQSYVTLLGSAVERGTKVGFLLTRIEEVHFDRAVFVEFFHVAEDLRHNLGVSTGSTFDRFGQGNRGEVRRWRFLLSIFHSLVSFLLRAVFDGSCCHRVAKRSDVYRLVSCSLR
jgi:hypothetical protein